MGHSNARSLLLSLIFLSTATALLASDAWTQQSTQERAVWEVQLARNAQARSNITIQNQCQQPHTFSVTEQQTPFLELLAAQPVNVPGKSSYNLPVRFNTSGLNATQYQGTVVVKCETCKKEKTCQQDREILPIRLTVLPDNPQQKAGPQPGVPPPPQAIPIATPTPSPTSTPTTTQTPEPSPTPKPTPSSAMLLPTPTPSPSPSPCASPPPPTTYSVKNLGPLSESDYPASCRATGVNDAGNVIGVCSPSYFGISGGASHAFRTETGKVIDKEKDDLGLPAGITSGGAFATGINADGHVVGYWTSGADKAFWHDGSRKGESSKYSKMIDLHPGKSFTTSRAFAVNKGDDVVGAAYDPKVGPGSALGITFGGHAVIWPGADPKKMKDLNDDVDAKYKKDWILIAAFGISDDGDIVGRALNKKGKYHAFLLKGVGGTFFDLGALKEDMVDSSAAYAINECGEKVPAIDKVVGYTLTTTSAHYGFIWTEASGLMDFGALPAYSSVPSAMESYGQAINKKGEVVGASGPSYYMSYFEGLGAGPGLPGGLCVPYSHAVWYNGSELKDLNKLIPDSPGWELDLANGINDKGLIAGSGYYKCFVKKFGGLAEAFSHVSHAVLLTPAGLTPTPPGPGPASSSTAACPLSLPSGGYIFDNWNICGVKNGPTKDTTFTIAAPSVVTFIATYHWNYGSGALPGGKGISLKDSSGKVYGPWTPVITSPGSGGKINVNWECHPGITLPAGTYTVIDPDPATWSQNDASGNSGFVRVAGAPKK